MNKIVFHALSTAAKENNISIFEVKAGMQECLDEAWASKDKNVIAHRNKRFPKGKPTLEEFITTTAGVVRKQLY